MSEMVTDTVEPLGDGGGVEGANSTTPGSDGSTTTESLPPATLDNGLPGSE